MEEVVKFDAFDAEEEIFEFEKEMIHLDIISVVEEHMKKKGLKKNQLAKALDVSPSYITQLFMGDKQVNLDFMAKCQRVLEFKYHVSDYAKIREEKSNISHARIATQVILSIGTEGDQPRKKDAFFTPASLKLSSGLITTNFA